MRRADLLGCLTTGRVLASRHNHVWVTEGATG
jgi:hypothetical protein